MGVGVAVVVNGCILLRGRVALLDRPVLVVKAVWFDSQTILFHWPAVVVAEGRRCFENGVTLQLLLLSCPWQLELVGGSEIGTTAVVAVAAAVGIVVGQEWSASLGDILGDS